LGVPIGAFAVIEAWGFEYKTVGLNWIKQNRRGEGIFTGMSYWTRANSELCLLATRGSPQRLAMDVRQVIMAPVGEHSEKPEEAHKRIERLVTGPYLELFARAERPGWTTWGNVVESDSTYNADDDFAKSIDVAYEAVRERVANGGSGWMPKPAV
jgi:N6-adenosine-specific RNA methylase IME4